VVAFPISDVVGPDREPLPPQVHELIASQVGEPAAFVERTGVPRQTLLELGRHGLFGSPLEPGCAQRELAELIAGADGDTWFCWVQHGTPLRTVQAAPDPGAWAASWRNQLQAGSAIAAVAFAHLRRPGQPNPIARRVPGGWRIDGTLDWITSWDIADVVLLMARDRDSDQVVQVLLPAGHNSSSPHLSVGPVLDLIAMRGTHTRPARLDDVFVADEYVVDVVPMDRWRGADDAKTVHASPAAFGVTRSAIAELAQLARERSSDTLHHLTEALSEECRQLRHHAYELLDASDSADRDEQLRVRARSLDLVMRATTAVVTARAGAAMIAGDSAERRVRTGLFLQVQAQTPASRESSLHLGISESESLVESNFRAQLR
jgi:alkylation response protein AidB-like acyl-CoA dehydrogenase